MSYNDLPSAFDVTVSPMLKNREIIRATVQLHVAHSGMDALLAVWPWANNEPRDEELRKRVSAAAESAANLWGLQFPSADAVLNESAYQSLAQAVKSITASDFLIRKAVVREIVPLSPRPPQPPPPRDTRTRAQKFIEEMDDDVSTLDELQRWEAESRRKYPEFWTNDFLGDLMKRKIETKRHSVLLGRRVM